MNFDKLFSDIDYKFNDLSLLTECLTHPSVSNLNNKKNYQRLEFLGDKVLSLVISEYLVCKYEKENEGDLSKRHAYLVSGEVLAQIAVEIGLDNYIILSQGEESSGGRSRASNLENVLEALIGAIYLDCNLLECKKFIIKFWQNWFKKNYNPPKDPVSTLQEIIQSKNKTLPTYVVVKSGGSDHDPKFEAKVQIDYYDLELTAVGTSKKEAQKEVAKLALKYINQL